MDADFRTPGMEAELDPALLERSRQVAGRMRTAAKIVAGISWTVAGAMFLVLVLLEWDTGTALVVAGVTGAAVLGIGMTQAMAEIAHRVDAEDRMKGLTGPSIFETDATAREGWRSFTRLVLGFGVATGGVVFAGALVVVEARVDVAVVAGLAGSFVLFHGVTGLKLFLDGDPESDHTSA